MAHAASSSGCGLHGLVPREQCLCQYGAVPPTALVPPQDVVPEKDLRSAPHDVVACGAPRTAPQDVVVNDTPLAQVPLDATAADVAARLGMTHSDDTLLVFDARVVDGTLAEAGVGDASVLHFVRRRDQCAACLAKTPAVVRARVHCAPRSTLALTGSWTSKQVRRSYADAPMPDMVHGLCAECARPYGVYRAISRRVSETRDFCETGVSSGDGPSSYGFEVVACFFAQDLCAAARDLQHPLRACDCAETAHVGASGTDCAETALAGSKETGCAAAACTYAREVLCRLAARVARSLVQVLAGALTSDMWDNLVMPPCVLAAIADHIGPDLCLYLHSDHNRPLERRKLLDAMGNTAHAPHAVPVFAQLVRVAPALVFQHPLTPIPHPDGTLAELETACVGAASGALSVFASARLTQLQCTASTVVAWPCLCACTRLARLVIAGRIPDDCINASFAHTLGADGMARLQHLTIRANISIDTLFELTQLAPPVPASVGTTQFNMTRLQSLSLVVGVPALKFTPFDFARRPLYEWGIAGTLEHLDITAHSGVLTSLLAPLEGSDAPLLPNLQSVCVHVAGMISSWGAVLQHVAHVPRVTVVADRVLDQGMHFMVDYPMFVFAHPTWVQFPRVPAADDVHRWVLTGTHRCTAA